MFYYRPIFFILGSCLLCLGTLMLFPAIIDWYENDADWMNFLIASFLVSFVGTTLALTNNCTIHRLSIRQIFFLITSTYLIIPAAASIPFYASGYVTTVTDAYFEAMAGFTTTAATVFVDLDRTSAGMLLWRAILQWTGGMSTLTITIFAMPLLGIGGMQFFKVDSSANPDKISRHILEFIAHFFSLYLILTCCCAILLWIFGMNFFDAVCHAMTTLSTGGFSNHNQSIAYYHSLSIEIILSVFMILSVLPYLLMLKLFYQQKLSTLRDSQLTLMIKLLFLAVIFSATWLSIHLDLSFNEALRKSYYHD